MSRFLSFLFAMLGIAMITWPGGAAAQYFDPWGPPPGYYGPPPTGYRGPPEPPSCRIQNGVDYGGEWKKCSNIAGRLNRHRIDYECVSFCTLKLASRNVCVTRGARRLGFHGVSYGGPDSQNIDSVGNAKFLRGLPARIAARVLSSGALKSKEIWYMSGEEAISLGIRECS
jgi:hypothetical protein